MYYYVSAGLMMQTSCRQEELTSASHATCQSKGFSNLSQNYAAIFTRKSHHDQSNAVLTEVNKQGQNYWSIAMYADTRLAGLSTTSNKRNKHVRYAFF
jgi:hypothetical protein